MDLRSSRKQSAFQNYFLISQTHLFDMQVPYLLLSITSMKTKGKGVVRLSWNPPKGEKEYERKSKGICGQIFTNTKEYTLSLVPGCPSSSELPTMKFLFALNWPLVAYLFTLTSHTWSICCSPQMWNNLIQGRRVSSYLCQGNYPAWMVILPQSIPFFCTPSSQVSFHSSQNYRLLLVFF